MQQHAIAQARALIDHHMRMQHGVSTDGDALANGHKCADGGVVANGRADGDGGGGMNSRGGAGRLIEQLQSAGKIVIGIGGKQCRHAGYGAGCQHRTRQGIL